MLDLEILSNLTGTTLWNLRNTLRSCLSLRLYRTLRVPLLESVNTLRLCFLETLSNLETCQYLTGILELVHMVHTALDNTIRLGYLEYYHAGWGYVPLRRRSFC